MTVLTRGPLPARVYWTRRVAVLVVLAGLVLGCVQLARIATGGTPPEPDRAAPMAAEPGSETSSDDSVAEETESPDEGKAKKQQGRKQDKKRKKRTDKGPVLVEPEGTCDDSDVAVTPTVDEAVGGSPITFVLELRSVDSVACSWQVSPRSVTVKVTSGKDDIWSSLQCPRAIPRKPVVVRNNVSTEVEVTWSARRSEEGCNTGDGEWALPGWYFVKAAALAGEPSDLHFEVTRPEPKVVTETVKPKHQKGDKRRHQDGQGDGKRD